MSIRRRNLGRLDSSRTRAALYYASKRRKARNNTDASSIGPTVSKNCAGQITATGGYPAPPIVSKNNAGQITATAG